MILIREASRADADACAAAHIEGWRVGYRNLLPADFLDAPQFASQRLDRWRAWTWADGLHMAGLFVAEVHGEVVGHVVCSRARMPARCARWSLLLIGLLYASRIASSPSTRSMTTSRRVKPASSIPQSWRLASRAAPMPSSMSMCSPISEPRTFASKSSSLSSRTVSYTHLTLPTSDLV